MKTWWLFLLLFILANNTVRSQHRIGNFLAYGGNHGLPASFYYAVLQSSDGYLWIGSSSGLIRFDGKRYNTFFSDYADPNSISDNIVNDSIEDDQHHLWIAGASQGLTRYDLRTSQMKRGYRWIDGTFTEVGTLGFWWSATNVSLTYASHRYLASSVDDLDGYHEQKIVGVSVRCIRD